MKEEQKKLEFYRKTIFSYIEEMYGNDEFLMSMIKRYNEINDKVVPLIEMAKRAKEIMDITDKISVPKLKEKLIDLELTRKFGDSLNEGPTTTKLPNSILDALIKSKEIIKTVESNEKMTSTKIPSLNNEEIILPDFITSEKNEMGYMVYTLTLETDDENKDHFNRIFNNNISHVLSQNDVDSFVSTIAYDVTIKK